MLRRRAFLTQAAGLAAAGLALNEGSNRVQAQSGPKPAGQPASNPAQFYQDADFNFNFLGLLGAAYEGLADVGAVLAVIAQVPNGDAAAAITALIATGERLATSAAASLAAGDRVSAREAYLQAATFTFMATYYFDGAGQPERFAPTWLRHQELWDAGAALLNPPMERVRIPYAGTTLPGYFFKADDSGRPRPLVILTNGSDGGMPTGFWTLGAAAALRRGYNVLAYYGPGQGLALIQQQLYFRPDWEAVVTPVVDYALTRPEVDPGRVVLSGISQGGYWAPRAAAFEPRLAALIADPGVYDVSTSWTGALPPEMIALLKAGNKAQFDGYFAEGLKDDPGAAATLAFRMRPFGMTSYFDVYSAVQQYTLAGITGQIRCPTLITSPEGEQFWPGQSEQLFAALTSPKAIVPFTAAEGANLHCEPMAPGLRAQRIFDWLDGILR